MSASNHRCPHCQAIIAISVVAVSPLPTPLKPPAFDRSDPVQVEGYRAAEKGGTLPRPYADGTPESYRFNRGLHHFWDGGKLP